MDPQKRADEWNQLKRSPAHILMLTEATDALQEYLAEETPEVGGGLTPSAVQGTAVVECLATRECRQWLAIKGGEKKNHTTDRRPKHRGRVLGVEVV